MSIAVLVCDIQKENNGTACSYINFTRGKKTNILPWFADCSTRQTLCATRLNF